MNMKQTELLMKFARENNLMNQPVSVVIDMYLEHLKHTDVEEYNAIAKVTNRY